MAVLNGWRIAGWGMALALLLLPALAMQVTREVNWTASDFVVFGAMLASAGLGVEFLVRQGDGLAYRAGVAVMTLALFLLVWINLAVGIIGSEKNGANLLYAAVIALAVGGAMVVHFRPAGMRRTMLATLMAQLLVGVVAVAANLGSEGVNWPRDTMGVTAMFALLWLLAAGLFGRAARDQARVSG